MEQGHNTFPKLARLGVDAWLVQFTDRLDDAANRAALAFRASVEAAQLAHVIETASTLGSTLIRFDSGATDGADLAEALKALLNSQSWADAPLPSGRRLWRVPTAWDGPQLPEAAGMAGLSVADAVAQLSTQTVRVLALGFSPGMPYLGILPEAWGLSRQSDLTPRVPEGALCVAVQQFVLFGTSAPTGWRHIANTGFGCFRPDRTRAIALSPGDMMCFPSVSRGEMEDRAGADPSGYGGADVSVLE